MFAHYILDWRMTEPLITCFYFTCVRTHFRLFWYSKVVHHFRVQMTYTRTTSTTFCSKNNDFPSNDDECYWTWKSDAGKCCEWRLRDDAILGHAQSFKITFLCDLRFFHFERKFISLKVTQSYFFWGIINECPKNSITVTDGKNVSFSI